MTSNKPIYLTYSAIYGVLGGWGCLQGWDSVGWTMNRISHLCMPLVVHFYSLFDCMMLSHFSLSHRHFDVESVLQNNYLEKGNSHRNTLRNGKMEGIFVGLFRCVPGVRSSCTTQEYTPGTQITQN